MTNYILKNGTPHDVVVVDDAGNVIHTYPTTEWKPRCTCNRVPTGDTVEGGIPLTRTVYGEVEGLPPYEEGVLWIVSALVRSACPERRDLVSPGEQVRTEKGVIVGCKTFDCNF